MFEKFLGILFSFSSKLQKQLENFLKFFVKNTTHWVPEEHILSQEWVLLCQTLLHFSF